MQTEKSIPDVLRLVTKTIGSAALNHHPLAAVAPITVRWHLAAVTRRNT